MNTAKSSFGKLKIAHVAMALAALASAGGYGWRIYSLFRDAQVHMPRPQIEKLVKDLQRFHSQTSRFPRNFVELNDLIWHTQPKPNYGTEGRQARTKNYYYFYTRVDEQRCAIWAVPLGPRRDDASSFFLVIAPDWERIWRGKSLDESAISTLPPVPSGNELTSLQLIELPIRILNGRTRHAVN